VKRIVIVDPAPAARVRLVTPPGTDPAPAPAPLAPVSTGGS
jgi:hypothetical protein